MMRATKDARWAAVYGAAYAYCYSTMTPGESREAAIKAANEAIATEPEEAELEKDAWGRYVFGAIDVSHGMMADGTGCAHIHDRDNGDELRVTRYEAAALARLLARFAETGEL